MGLHTIELFAGVGMLGEGLRSGLGYMGIQNSTIAYVEREAYPASVLAARMQEGSLDAAPIWPDVCTFDGTAFRGKVDCIVAGFPCQDLSIAGRRAGLDGARSGLFFEILRIADDSEAWGIFLENVAGIATATASVVDEAEGELEERATARVLGELADRGWNAEWLTLSASDVGASHGRARWFCWAWRKVGHAGHDARSAGNGEQQNPTDTGARQSGAVGGQRQLDDTNGSGAQRTGRAQFGADFGREELGNPGLQHQHLQQREDGAEHSGAGQPVADPQCPERWPLSFSGAGGEQGHDGGRPEAHGRPRVSDEVLGDTQDHNGRREQPAGYPGQWGPGLAGASEQLADASSQGQQRPKLGRARTGNGGGAGSTWIN